MEACAQGASFLKRKGPCPGSGAPLQTGASPRPPRPWVAREKPVIYTARSDTSSLHLPTIKRGLVVTNGPHAHGTAALGDPALICRPWELIHPFLAAQVRVDKSSLLESQLQGHHSVAIEDRLEFVNFIFYWSSWQHGATEPPPLRRGGFPIHQHSPPARAPLSPHRAWWSALKAAGCPHCLPARSRSCPKGLLLSRLWERC